MAFVFDLSLVHFLRVAVARTNSLIAEDMRIITSFLLKLLL